VLRALALLVVLVPAAIGGYLMVAQDQSGAGSARTSPVLTAAGAALETHHRATGTYAGMQIAVGGVRVVRADATSYCVEAMGMHLAGPDGQPAPGGC
jgi:hypothetical protein